MTILKLLSDQAIADGDDKKQDGLGFETYSRVLGNAALGTSGPFTIGIFGEWGTGKISLMRLTQKYIAENANVVTVWFNAWRYEKEEHPIVPLIATIIRDIESNKTFKERLFKGGRDLIQSLRAVAYGFSAKSKIKIPGLAEVEASFVAKEMIDRAESLAKDPLLGRSLYYEAFERLSATSIGDDSKIVVFVDDLDRCFPDLAIKLLESIKLVLSQPGFIFVLGVARTVIEGYLKHRYEKEYGLKDFEGQSYLDKIVQLPFHIPPHTERVHQLSDSVTEQLDAVDRDGFGQILPSIAATTGGNPRATIRFVNNLLIDRAINHVLSASGEMETIPIEYFAVTRTLQQRWQDVFSLLATSPDLALQVAEWQEADLAGHANSEIEDEDKVTVATRLLTDKDLTALLFSSHGRAWLSGESLRTASLSFIRGRRQNVEGFRQEAAKSYDLFISYGRDDVNHVRKIVDRLVKEDLSVFFDVASLMPGQRWDAEIRSALSSAKAVLVCLGSEERKLGFINQEIKIALDVVDTLPEGSTFIIPVLLPGADPDSVPTNLAQFQWLDMRQGINDQAVKLIKRALVGR